MKKLIVILMCCFPCWLMAQEKLNQVVVISSQTGIATYYAGRFEGRNTSSGEKFCNHKLTAAHKSLPFGTRVRVTNLCNDKSVIVTINDRLPQSSTRSIDLTQEAAKELDFIQAGKVKVRIEILD